MKKLALVATLCWVGIAQGGQLDVSWAAPTTHTDGSPIAGFEPLTYHVYWALYPQTPCPGTQFLVTDPSFVSDSDALFFRLTGLTQGMTYDVQVTALNGAGESPCSVIASAPAQASAAVTNTNFGETVAGTSVDSQNGNLLVVQRATLSTAGTLTTLSFYVDTTGGSLRLGLYADNNGPTTKLAETASFTPVIGWNTVSVISQVNLQPGTYWLAYLPSSDALSFRLITGGSERHVPFTFGTLPATYPSGANTGTVHWSFYGTVQSGSGNLPLNVTNPGVTFGP